MSNTRYLRRRGKGWAAVVYVPTHLRAKVGAREIVKGLGTRDLEEANRRKWRVIAEIHRELARLDDPKLAAAAIAEQFDPDDEGLELALSAQAESIERSHGEAEAVAFYKIATRRRVPVSLALQQWLEQADGIRESTRGKYKRHVERFIAWANDPAVNRVDRRMAGAYVGWLRTTPNPQTRKPSAHKTIKNVVSSLSGLWDWMERRGLVKGDNPWSRQVGAAPGQRRERITRDRRPLTRDKARKWYAAAVKHEQAQGDLIILGWHTGIRADDLCSLTTDQVQWDAKAKVYWLTLTGGKTEANARVLPVVSTEAKAVLRRRLEEAKGGVLFHELEPSGPDAKRYWGIQKRTNYQRRRVLRDAPVDFHSLRRAFSAACEDVGLDPVQWSRMMGHDAPTLAAAVYNRGTRDGPEPPRVSRSPSATPRRPKPRHATTPCPSNTPLPRDSNQMASGKPGAVQRDRQARCERPDSHKVHSVKV